VFDAATGGFVLAQTATREVSVEGQGNAAFWTRRALERRGFRIVDRNAHLHVIVVDNGTCGWRVHIGHAAYDSHSLREATELLANSIPEPGAVEKRSNR